MREVLKSLGWTAVGSVWVKGITPLILNDDAVEFIDAIYKRGWQDGINRLLYESEQMEDADPEISRRAEKIARYAETQGL